MGDLTPDERRALERGLLRLNGKAWGIATGLVAGLGLFLATVFLVWKGGATVGPHLALLGAYFPGYRVTVGGAFIGFIYLFVIGYAVGRLVGWCYNLAARTLP